MVVDCPNADLRRPSLYAVLDVLVDLEMVIDLVSCCYDCGREERDDFAEQRRDDDETYPRAGRNIESGAEECVLQVCGGIMNLRTTIVW